MNISGEIVTIADEIFLRSKLELTSIGELHQELAFALLGVIVIVASWDALRSQVSQLAIIGRLIIAVILMASSTQIMNYSIDLGGAIGLPFAKRTISVFRWDLVKELKGENFNEQEIAAIKEKARKLISKFSLLGLPGLAGGVTINVALAWVVYIISNILTAGYALVYFLAPFIFALSIIPLFSKAMDYMFSWYAVCFLITPVLSISLWTMDGLMASQDKGFFFTVGMIFSMFFIVASSVGITFRFVSSGGMGAALSNVGSSLTTGLAVWAFNMAKVKATGGAALVGRGVGAIGANLTRSAYRSVRGSQIQSKEKTLGEMATSSFHSNRLTGNTDRGNQSTSFKEYAKEEIGKNPSNAHKKFNKAEYKEWKKGKELGVDLRRIKQSPQKDNYFSWDGRKEDSSSKVQKIPMPSSSQEKASTVIKKSTSSATHTAESSTAPTRKESPSKSSIAPKTLKVKESGKIKGYDLPRSSSKNQTETSFSSSKRPYRSVDDYLTPQKRREIPSHESMTITRNTVSTKTSRKSPKNHDLRPKRKMPKEGQRGEL